MKTHPSKSDAEQVAAFINALFFKRGHTMPVVHVRARIPALSGYMVEEIKTEFPK